MTEKSGEKYSKKRKNEIKYKKTIAFFKKLVYNNYAFDERKCVLPFFRESAVGAKRINGLHFPLSEHSAMSRGIPLIGF